MQMQRSRARAIAGLYGQKWHGRLAGAERQGDANELTDANEYVSNHLSGLFSGAFQASRANCFSSGKEYRVQVAKSSKKKAPRALPSKPKTSTSAKSKKASGKVKSKPPGKKPVIRSTSRSSIAVKKPVYALKPRGKAVTKTAKSRVPTPRSATPAKGSKTKTAPATISPATIAPSTISARPPAKPAKPPVPASTQSSTTQSKTTQSKTTQSKTAQTKTVAKAPPAPLPSTKPGAKPAAKSTRSPAPTAHKAEPFLAQPAVATNLKPRKSQIGLGVRELEHFADMLLAKRRELVGDMSSMEREALRTGSGSNLSTLPVHMADMGTDNYEQEFTLTLVEKDRTLLREINHALAKIQNGTYGICEGTGIPIAKARLEVQPWTRFSIEYARQREKNGMGVRTL
jgi:RNA polymerase-binding protein DksA